MKSAHLSALGIVVAGGLALAFGTSARGDDRSSILALLSLLEKDTAHAALIADDLKQVRDALERATRMRDANDQKHAHLTEALAAEWVQLAADTVRAAEAERTATEIRLAANDAGGSADRERALLEEAIAHQGRLRAELDGLEHPSEGGSDRTSHASADAGPAAARRKGSPDRTSDAGGGP